MYVDGFLIPVSAEKKAAYIEAARYAAAVHMDHGATRIVECWKDDVPDGQHTSFPMAIKKEEGEVVVFSWIEYPNKETRDACHAASMADPRFADPDMTAVPFDPERLIFGGFTPILQEPSTR